MLSKIIKERLSLQFCEEMSAYYSYLKMSSILEVKDFNGAAKWSKIQAEEERGHAMKIMDYMLQHDEVPSFREIDAAEFPSYDFRDLFSTALNMERNNSKLVSVSLNTARDEGDHATYNFLLWFATEQVEEEDMIDNIIGRIKMGGDPILIDQELGRR